MADGMRGKWPTACAGMVDGHAREMTGGHCRGALRAPIGPGLRALGERPYGGNPLGERPYGARNDELG